jgi:hypothetical protein
MSIGFLFWSIGDVKGEMVAEQKQKQRGSLTFLTLLLDSLPHVAQDRGLKKDD